MKTNSRLATAVIAAAVLLAPATPASAAPPLCGAVITDPGTTITLTEDLHCDALGITVRAENVTIELNGFTLVGHPGTGTPSPLLPAGIMVDNARNTRILNGAITGFTSGVTVTKSTVTEVRDLTIHDTHSDGMRLDDTTGVFLDNVEVLGAGPHSWSARGIVGNKVNRFAAHDIRVSQWADNGMIFEHSTEFQLTNSSVLNNAGEGISLWHVSGSVTLDTVTSSGNDQGIRMTHTGSPGSVRVTNSTTNGNVNNGLYATNVTNARITNHTANSNGGEGIWMTSGIDAVYGYLIPFTAVIESSTAKGNVRGGISMSDVGRWTLTGNLARSNGDSGFGFFGGSATLSGNVSEQNGLHGYAWDINAHGTSTGDDATGNAKNGVYVHTRTKERVWLTNVTATSNQLNGIQLVSGVVNVTGGNYSYNKVEGIQANSGDLFVKNASAIKNGRNGIAYLGNAAGTIETVTSNKNGRYGICISKRYFGYVFDVPPHQLLSNSAGPRGTKCTELILILPPTWPYLPSTILPSGLRPL